MNRSSDHRGRTLPAFLVTVAGVSLLHLLLGWAWTMAGAAIGGWIAGRRGWIVGAAGGGLVWTAFVAWSFAVDARAVGEMTRIVGELLGGLPGSGAVALTIAIGVALGALGGQAGSLARNILRPVAR